MQSWITSERGIKANAARGIKYHSVYRRFVPAGDYETQEQMGGGRRRNTHPDCFEPLSPRGTYRVSLRDIWLNHSPLFQRLRDLNAKPTGQMPITRSRMPQAPDRCSRRPR